MFKRSVWKTAPVQDKYELLFAPELIPYFKTGRHYSTYRFGWEKYGYLKIGDEIKIKENNSEKVLFTAKITAVIKTTFIYLPLESGITHQFEKTKEEQRTVFSGYYAFLGRPIADNDPFLIIEFELT